VENKRRVKVRIADRVYPLSIIADQEEVLRKAESMINEKIESFKGIYIDKDNQDFLSMASLQIVMKTLQKESSGDMESVLSELVKIEDRLDLLTEKM